MSTQNTEALYWSRVKYQLTTGSDSFAYACKNFFRVQAKESFGMPLFKFNNVQKLVLQYLKKYHTDNGNIRVVIGKARQLGMSTFFTALLAHPVLFRENRNALLVTHDEDSSKSMLIKHKILYDGLPKVLRPQRGVDTTTLMSFPKLGTQIMANHARNLNVGAGSTQHLVHLSEVARYPDASTVQSSLFPSISTAKSRVFGESSAIIMESTSFRGGDWYKAFGEEARLGRNGFGFLFVPWFKHELYYKTPPKGFTPTPEEQAWLKKYVDDGLSWGNLFWRRQKKSEYQLSQLRGTGVDNGGLFEQEYPFSWEDSWVLPGGSSRVFTDSDIKSIYESKVGVPHWPTPKGLVRDIGASLDIFSQPVDGRHYDVGIDPSGGRTEHSDYTAIEVVDRQTLEQIAEARHHFDPASIEFLEFVYWLGKIYNNAQLIIDVTGGWGQALTTFLAEKRYYNIYQRRRLDDSKERISATMGFVYTARSKRDLISQAVVFANRGEPKIHSEQLYKEISVFLQFGEDEYGAAPGYHDDLVNAWMLALLGASGERVSNEKPLEMAKFKPPDVDKCFYHDPISLLHRDGLRLDRRSQFVVTSK